MEKGQIRRSAQTYRTDHYVLKDAKWNRTQWTRYITLDASSLQFLGLYELCRTSQVMIWCDALCDPVCISIICWHFSRCFGHVYCLQISFCIERKRIKAFLWKDSAPGKMWPVRLVPLFTKWQFLIHSLILLHPLLSILDKFFYPENLTPSHL